MTWILPESEVVPSPHFYRGRMARGFVEPVIARVLIIHYAVDGDQSGDDDADLNFAPRERDHDCMDVLRGMARPERKRSAHFVVGRDGSKGQAVRLSDGAWAAGDQGLSRFPDRPPARLEAAPFLARRVNLMSTHIELCNVGYDVDKFKVPAAERVRAKHPAQRDAREWERFTDPQYSTTEYLAAQLRPAQPTLEFVCGHEDVTNRHTMGRVGGKVDPGPAYDWSRVPWRALGYLPIAYSFTTTGWVEREGV